MWSIRRNLRIWSYLVKKILVENLIFSCSNSGKIKLEIIARNWMYELLHELPNDLRIRILWNEKIKKALYFSFHRLNDSWTHEFELVSYGFELVTCKVELVTHAFNLKIATPYS